jgi:hypothetical protein
MHTSSTDEEWHERLYDVDRDGHEAQDLPLEHCLALRIMNIQFMAAEAAMNTKPAVAPRIVATIRIA